MVRGIPDILNWFSNTQKSFWRIYALRGQGTGNYVMQSPQNEGQSHGDAYQDLQTKIRVLNRGCFTMVAYDAPDRLPSKGYQFTDIEITSDNNLQVAAAVNGPAPITEADITSRVDSAVKAALTAYKTEQELTDLKKKLTELEKEKRELEKSVNDPWNKMIGALAPYSDKIVSGIFPQAPAAQVAGLPAADPGPEENTTVAEETTALTPEQQEVLSNFVTALAANDADWVNTLQRLTKAIFEKPTMITMVKNFI